MSRPGRRGTFAGLGAVAKVTAGRDASADARSGPPLRLNSTLKRSLGGRGRPKTAESIHSSSRDSRADEGTEERIGLRWSEPAVSIDPPIQHQNERRNILSDQEVRRHLASCFCPVCQLVLHAFGNQIHKCLFEMFVQDDSSATPNLHPVATAVLVDVVRGWEY